MLEGVKELLSVAGIGIASGIGSIVLTELGEKKMAVALGIVAFLASGLMVLDLLDRAWDKVESVFHFG